MSKVLKKEACPNCRSKGRDHSGDNLVVYEGGGAHCFSCNFTVLSEEYKLEHGLLNQIYEHEEEGGVLEFQESWERIKNKTRTEGKGYRGIDDETYAKFSVRHEYKTLLQGGVETEELVAQYYPLTATIDDNLQVCGVKVRSLPKKFRAEGLNKANITHLFGQANYLTSLSKTVVLCSGEIDMLSTYQMLRDLNQQAPAIMSITVGENGVEQYQTHYEYLNKFEKIVIIPDNDLPGKKALKEAVKCLPKDKVYVLEIPELYKDPNDMLIAGKEADFVTLYFRAKPYVPDGIVGSSELFQSLLDTIEVEKIPLPPFLFELQEMLSGGLTLESIVNIAAASGIGKSSYVNELIYHWIFESPYKVGIVSLELSAGQYANALFSRHVHKKLSLLSQEDVKEYLNSEEAAEKANELFKNEDGTDRFYLVEDRSSKLNIMQDLIEQLIIGCGCKVIVLDPLQDLFAGVSLEQQEQHMAWQKVIVKLYGVCIVNINHTRKAGSTKESGSLGNMITEEDIQGTSSIYKSGSVNILLQRNKLAEDPLERNTTYVYLSKNRVNGVTGPAGKILYDNESHTLYDESTYRELHPEMYAQEYNPEDGY